MKIESSFTVCKTRRSTGSSLLFTAQAKIVIKQEEKNFEKMRRCSAPIKLPHSTITSPGCYSRYITKFFSKRQLRLVGRLLNPCQTSVTFVRIASPSILGLPVDFRIVIVTVPKRLLGSPSFALRYIVPEQNAIVPSIKPHQTIRASRNRALVMC